MSDNFDELNPWLDRISQQLDDGQKRRLNRKISSKLKTMMRKRIRDQKDPDGRRFAPRKRDRPGSTRRGAMFKKLPKQIKTSYTSKRAEVGFAGRTADVMKVHQYGETIKPSENASPTRYAVRETVGFSSEDKHEIVKVIRDFLLND